jgi:hypothetical protein
MVDEEKEKQTIMGHHCSNFHIQSPYVYIQENWVHQVHTRPRERCVEAPRNPTDCVGLGHALLGPAPPKK